MEAQSCDKVREEVGARIRRRRVEQGLSLRRLALMVGMDYAYLCKVECGKANATIDALVKIANGLGLPICDFF